MRSPTRLLLSSSSLSAGKERFVALRRLIRCTSNGSAAPNNPSKNNGSKKLIEAFFLSLETRSQESQRDLFDRLGGREANVLHITFLTLSLDFVEVRAHHFHIPVAQVIGIDEQFAITFQTLEQRQPFIGQLELGGIDDVKDGDLEAARAEESDGDATGDQGRPARFFFHAPRSPEDQRA